MKIWFRNTIYTRKIGIEILKYAAYDKDEFYKHVLWIWLWRKVLVVFIFKTNSDGWRVDTKIDY